MTSSFAASGFIEPTLPDLSDDLVAEAESVEALILRLDGLVSGGLEYVIGPLFRSAHTHYSLYIEDRPSLLADLADANAPRPAGTGRDRNADLRASLELLAWLHDGDGRARAMASATDPVFIAELHRRFYEHLPPEARLVRTRDTERELDIAPGAWRTERVTVGAHDAPAADMIEPLMRHWGGRYAPGSRPAGAVRLLAAIASHHRLLFIHPFRDGNGRVARLALDASLIALGLDARGAWTPARGFARTRGAYYAALAAADAERRNATDGRGRRSAAGLAAWCRYVLGVFREQAEFVGALLEPRTWRERVRRALTDDLALTTAARASAYRLVAAVWELGPLTRAEIARESGVSERSARRLLAVLGARGWVRAAASEDRRTAPLVGAMPLRCAPVVFPGVFLPEA